MAAERRRIEVVLAALGRSGSALQYASEELRGDREVFEFTPAELSLHET